MANVFARIVETGTGYVDTCAARGFFRSFLDGITGNKIITEDDLAAPLRRYQVRYARSNTGHCGAMNYMGQNIDYVALCFRCFAYWPLVATGAFGVKECGGECCDRHMRCIEAEPRGYKDVYTARCAHTQTRICNHSLTCNRLFPSCLYKFVW